MNEADKAEIIARYESRLGQYGHDVRTLASGSDEKQAIRYRTLCEIGIETGDSILDIGCGFGDFYGFLKREGIDVKYTGYDIVPGLIEAARKDHPDAVFELADIQNTPPSGSFDWVTSSQAFNNKLKYENNAEVVKQILMIAFDACLKGIAFDMMSKLVDFQEDRLYYFDPADMFYAARSLTKRVVLRHDYLHYEFCLYIYKDPHK